MPWANGGGSTRLLWSDPVGGRRVSIAMLTRPAPFSVLPGMARLLVVLDPIVVGLDIDGGRTTLRRHDAIAFAGDDPVALVALDRPGRVLNLMCRADRWVPSTDHAACAPVAWIATPGGDLVFGSRPTPQAIAIRFVAVDPPAAIG